MDCNRGISVGNKLCLCPPSYYGEFCQFQSDRLSIHLAFEFGESPIDTDQLPKFFRLIATLLNERNEFVDREEFILQQLVSEYKHIFYLVYSNPDEQHLFYSVRFDTFTITLDSVRFLSTQTVPIPFGFLPVNRLALKINLTNEFIKNSSNSSFSPESIACPLGRYGRQCKFRFDPCNGTNLCKNGGTCYPFDMRMPDFPFVCFCPVFYFGSRCELVSARALIQVSRSVQKQFSPSTGTNEVPLIVLYFTDVYSGLPRFIIQEHFIYTNVRFESPFLVYYHRRPVLSQFIFAKTFFSARQSDYYLVGLHKRSVSFERASLLTSHHCPHADTLEFWSSYNWTGDELNYLHKLKLYHRACYTIGLQCFYDDFYICICDNEARVECFLFNHTAANCFSTSMHCLNEGLCQRSSLSSSNPPFACACPTCFYGDLCQFTTSQYSISLDALEFHWSILIVVCVIVLIGTLANLLSIAVFIQREVCVVGCSFYLIASSIISQIGLLTFLAKFIHLYGTWANYTVFCVGLEFLLAILPSTFDWLTACVAVERTMNIIKGAKFDKKLSIRVAKCVIIAVVLFNSIATIHEPFYRRLIDDPRHKGQTWCVLDLSHTPWLITYEKITNIGHIVGPFLINLFSVLIFLVGITKWKAVLINKRESRGKKSYSKLFIEHVRRYKHCLISPFLLLLFGLPRLAFTFVFACIEYPWQQQISIASYLVSALPMAMTFVVFLLPSPDYMKVLKKMSLVKLVCDRFRR